MLKPLRIIKKCLYTITRSVGLQNNLHGHQQLKEHTSDTTTLQRNSVNKLRSILINKMFS